MYVDVVDPDEPSRRWRLDADFLESNWRCIWNEGCKGVLDAPTPELQQGCCSFGAQLLDEDEARLVDALAATLDPARFEFGAEAASGGVFRDDHRTHTRLVGGACIFLNRPGFEGGDGCALHLGALDAGESPTEWKPSVCWQAPIKVDRQLDPDGTEVATVRPWARHDWEVDGESMAWMCTEPGEAFSGENRVIDSLELELTELLGASLYRAVRVELRPNES